jgi:hypothetical protein
MEEKIKQEPKRKDKFTFFGRPIRDMPEGVVTLFCQARPLGHTEGPVFTLKEGSLLATAAPHP